jgi:hypothetical protein
MEDVRKRRAGGCGKRRPLRGAILVSAALSVLSKWTTLSPETHPINISRLARELGVTRQAIYSNDLEAPIDEHRNLQRKNFSAQREALSLRRPLEERIACMEEELLDMRQKIDGWIERWAAVEYNARMLGLDADKIFAPMPPPDRMLVSVGRRSGRENNEE